LSPTLSSSLSPSPSPEGSFTLSLMSASALSLTLPPASDVASAPQSGENFGSASAPVARIGSGTPTRRSALAPPWPLQAATSSARTR